MKWLKRIVVALVVALAVLAGISLLLPSQVMVERTVLIDAPQATVFAVLDGYRLFNKWSPWADLDPNAKYTYEGPDFGVGARMAWSGDEHVESGSQTITASAPYETIASKLQFVPMGEAAARFALSREASATKVAWGFEYRCGVNPLNRYMGLLMRRYIAHDFDKGLGRLKALVESLPRTDFAGLEVEVADAGPVTVAYVATSCAKDELEIARTIGASYMQIGEFMKARGLRQVAAPITIDTRRDETAYVFDAAIPIDRVPEGEVPADSPVRVKTTYAGKVLKVTHKGAYRDLPRTYERLSAWAAAHGYEPAAPPWNEYAKDPGTTPEPELVTNIYLPVS